MNAALLCCEMAAWYRAQGMTLAQAMDALYEKFGYYRNELQSVVLPGEDGMERMSAILTDLRAAPPHTLAGERVTRVRDYLSGLDGLPAGDVLELRTAHTKVIVRPSGTEPKLKLYYSAHARTMAEAAALCAAVRPPETALLFRAAGSSPALGKRWRGAASPWRSIPSMKPSTFPANPRNSRTT